MVDDLESRLRSAADQLRAERKLAAEERAEKLRARTELVSKVELLIDQWNREVHPLVEGAVRRTNEIMTDTGVQLEMRATKASAGGEPGNPPIPQLPVLHVIKTQKRRAQMASSSARSQREAAEAAKQFEALTRLDLRLDIDGNVTAVPRNYLIDVMQRPAVPIASFDGKAIGELLPEFVSEGLLGRATAGESADKPSLPKSPPVADKPVETNSIPPAVESIDASLSSSPTSDRGAIQRALQQNRSAVALLTTSLLLMVDERLESIKQTPANSHEAIQAQENQIFQYEEIKKLVSELLSSTAVVLEPNTGQEKAVDAAMSLATGMQNWWVKSHVEICNKSFDMGLFGTGVTLLWLVGAGGQLAAIIPGILVGGASVVDVLKNWAPKNPK